jgi:hypothetical protein
MQITLRHKVVAVINNITYRTLVLLALFVGIIVVLYPAHAYAYSYGDIEQQLPGGNGTAVAWDGGCWNTMRSNRDNGMPPRTSINSGGSYADTSWVSASGLGASTTVEVPYGTKSVSLQLNSVTFLCSALVSPDGAGADYPYGDSRVVRPDNTPNDRAPNPMGGSTNWPARTDNRFRVDGSYSTDGGAISLGAGQVLQNGRNDSTRYWFGSLPFTYTSPSSSGLTSDQTITIVVLGRSMVQYYGTQNYCIVGDLGRSSVFDYDRCDQEVHVFNITIKIKKSYTLTPYISTDVSGVVEPGSIANVSPTIKNSGPTTSDNTQWQVTQLVVAPGQAVPNAAGGLSPAATAPCGTYFQSLPKATCSTIKNGVSIFDTGGNVISGDPVATTPVVIGDLAAGTKVCYAFSVQPSSDSSDAWVHSAPTCLIIGKKPKVQVLGGDLIGAENINTSTTNKNIGGANYMFGSWIEYGIFAIKTITGAGSGAAYASGGLANANNCNSSLLSFTNSGNSNCSGATVIGNYSNIPSLPDVASNFPVASAPTLTAGGLNDQTKKGVFTSGNINLSGGSINKGRWLVLNAPGATVTISGDINYFPGDLQSISDIPQVVIIAKDINIQGNVKNIDAWLIASNSLNTCSDVAVAASLSSVVCGNDLRVNGPVMAGKLYLRRTSGSRAGADHSGDPAEAFNLRPDAYLWASMIASANVRAQTVYSTELPPRL